MVNITCCTALHTPTGRRVYIEMTNELVYTDNAVAPVFAYEDVGPGQIVPVEGCRIGDLSDIEPE